MKLTNRETADLCRSLHLLLHGGIGMADSIHLLACEESGSKREDLEAVGRILDAGGRLSEAMEEVAFFPKSARIMTAIGEETGNLEEALISLANYHDQRHRTAIQIKQAIAYPSLILVLMLGVIGVLLMKVLPVFDSVYASLGGQLTGVSAGLLYLGQLLQLWMPVLFGILMIAVLSALVLALSPAAAEKAVRLLKNRFGDKGILRQFNNARFAGALAMGMTSGLTIEEALDLSGKLLSDIPSGAVRWEHCAAAVHRGEDLTDALEDAGLLPKDKARMLAVGIRSGNGDQTMHLIADRMMEEAEEALTALVSKIEPAMVLTASILVGAILLSVMVPLLNIMSTIG